ncbi:MAG: hypothetical protein QM790_19900 [Nibricoccus sp.]
MKSALHLLSCCLLTLGLLGSAGCASNTVKPRAFEVRVKVDESLANTSLQVDLIGANSLADLPKWTTYSITEYWQPDNPLRKDATHLTAQFGRGLPITVTVPRDHPHWLSWLKSGVAHLVIIADLPGIANDQLGNADPRRLIIPLDKKLWPRRAPLEILVKDSGLKLLTKQKAQKE